ncbi:TPA: 4-fold beta flower protein [Pseudomonas aeruginosa]|uniref:4-fold beta flower protein n=1 Tax=Pseudomonas aeruginosa TaxID=287 RepID=UPI0008FB92D0|nr:hypothetical protein [Pseudomonas aeruginosa]EKV4552130.1 hypothetical protein [Pseudomonas aeruginosa]ELK6189179.1 hypothetical protein [Pseudomonas aeruginosa]MBG4558835.1 hypothetical protein [Pseudomonas aeruginosa]MBG6317115.1 hypothetical protein [Pseudomonas aeruginosa]MBG6691183.1 hypothetical protein [Pseudomonas aeruginosa]
MAETTLFDGSGAPVAYISDDAESNIYLWSGVAVAYIVDSHIYGFNGKHLGWFDQGIAWDEKGHPVGFVRSVCPKMAKLEPLKKLKKLLKLKSLRKLAPLRPLNKRAVSGWSLEEFLKQGAK